VDHHHVCIWIDRYKARFFGVGFENADTVNIEDRGPHHHIHRKADHVGQGAEPIDAAFLAEIASALASAKAILIVGPGKARLELAGYLNDQYPAVAKRIWGIEAMDHPTTGELAAAARKFFRAADRMHAL
jgi:hypothetical protein